MSVLWVDGQHLSADVLADRAADPIQVAVADEALARVRDSHDWAVRLGGQRPMYGRSTGVGANREVVVEPSVGAGGSGVSPPGRRRAGASDLRRCAAGDSRTRRYRHRGPVGARGHGAGAAGTLPDRRARRAALGPDDALPFLSSNAAALADAALGLARLSSAARAGLVVAALSFAALGGNLEAFSQAVERVTPMRGARITCEAMRALIGATPSATPRCSRHSSCCTA